MIAISDIKIIGIGGAGIAILNGIKPLLPEASFVAIDTDASVLAKCSIENQICLIENGEGAGGDTAIAQSGASEKASELEAVFGNSRLVVLVAGLGGGTGSIIAPMLAKVATENSNCEVISFTVSSLAIEGVEKTKLATKAKLALSRFTRASFTLPNDVILAKQNLPIIDAYAKANLYIVNMVQALARLLSSNGIVNIDFPTFVKLFDDNQTKQKNSFASFGRGYAENAVDDAIEQLQQSPLLPEDFSAKTMLLYLRCSPTFEMNKMQRLLELASQKFGSPAKMAFGAITDESLDTEIEVCAMGLCNEIVLQQAEIIEKKIESETKAEPVSTSFSNEEESVNETAEPEQPIKPKTEIEVAPPLQQTDVSIPPVPVEPEKKSFFGLGRRKKKQPVEVKPDDKQTEFKFVELSEQRGFFLDTPPNIRNGVDLDIPTYLRKGIKINL